MCLEFRKINWDDSGIYFYFKRKEEEILKKEEERKDKVNFDIRIEGIYVNCLFFVFYVWFIYDFILIFILWGRCYYFVDDVI